MSKTNLLMAAHWGLLLIPSYKDGKKSAYVGKFTDDTAI